MLCRCTCIRPHLSSPHCKPGDGHATAVGLHLGSQQLYHEVVRLVVEGVIVRKQNELRDLICRQVARRRVACAQALGGHASCGIAVVGIRGYNAGCRNGERQGGSSAIGASPARSCRPKPRRQMAVQGSWATGCRCGATHRTHLPHDVLLGSAAVLPVEGPSPLARRVAT